MKRALKEIDEINRLYDLVKSTDSSTFRRDCKKAIIGKVEDLREYCGYRGIDFTELSKLLKVRCSGEFIHLRYRGL